MSRSCVLKTKFLCLQEMPPSDPIELGDEGDWETVGELAGGSRSLAPTVEELLGQMMCQPPVPEGSTEPTAADTEEAAATEAQEEVSYGPPWAHYLSGYQDRLLGGPLGLPGLRYTAPEGVEHKDYTGVVLG
jgi:hypothetical protein